MIHTIWGAISLLCTLAIASKMAIALDLVCIAVIGLFLSASFQIRGMIYSLILLTISGAISHGFFVTDHLFQLGLETSLALAFFITALSFEEESSSAKFFEGQIQIKKSALENLEAELKKHEENATLYKRAMQEKVEMFQKELEELQIEHSSILILNDVLRKSSAKLHLENNSLEKLDQDQKVRYEILRNELVTLQNDYQRISNYETLATANRELTSELNGARFKAEQTALINETLNRLFERESLKAKEAGVEASAYAEQLDFSRKEVMRLQKVVEAISQEPKQDPETVEKLAYLERKMVQLSQTEPMLRQLKKQFEERNQTLHETRSELFKVDTELKRVAMEKVALELNPIPKEFEAELLSLGEKVTFLEDENQQLQELIEKLMAGSQDEEKPKKKVKTKAKLNIEQTLMF